MSVLQMKESLLEELNEKKKGMVLDIILTGPSTDVDEVEDFDFGEMVISTEYGFECMKIYLLVFDESGTFCRGALEYLVKTQVDLERLACKNPDREVTDTIDVIVVRVTDFIPTILMDAAYYIASEFPECQVVVCDEDLDTNKRLRKILE